MNATLEATAPVEAICPDCPWCEPALTGSAILDLFTAAPKMKGLWIPGAKISRAGANSSNPGGLWVTDGGGWGASTYFGSIRADGSFRASREMTSEVREVLKFVAAFGPQGLARIGIATGQCCYCGRLLTDPVSVALGYGPICAGYHGLPHSREAAAIAA